MAEKLCVVQETVIFWRVVTPNLEQMHLDRESVTEHFYHKWIYNNKVVKYSELFEVISLLLSLLISHISLWQMFKFSFKLVMNFSDIILLLLDMT